MNDEPLLLFSPVPLFDVSSYGPGENKKALGRLCSLPEGGDPYLGVRFEYGLGTFFSVLGTAISVVSYGYFRA
jgi:hypothetical protein